MKTPLLFAVASLAAFAQTPAPRPEFEAASIRLNTAGGPIVFNGMKSLGTFSSQNQTLRNLIQEAYGVTSGQHYFLPYLKAPGQGVPILGGPSWLGEDRWNITAKWNAASAGSPVTLQLLQTARSQMDLMLQTLLEQRFQLNLHRETRDMPVYELTLANPGKLKQAHLHRVRPGESGAAIHRILWLIEDRQKRHGLDAKWRRNENVGTGQHAFLADRKPHHHR